MVRALLTGLLLLFDQMEPLYCQHLNKETNTINDLFAPTDMKNKNMQKPSQTTAPLKKKDTKTTSLMITLPSSHYAIKEGDGARLFELYKLALLLYKTYDHYKYAYAVLLYLVKYTAILPRSQASRLKGNTFFNGSGLPGRNIPLNLQKEHDNKDIKCIWRTLSTNFGEHNAQRTAGTLESRQLVYKSVDRDCNLREQHFSRGNPKEEEAVSQIINNLLSNRVFTKTPGREGFESFPEFKRDLLYDLGYRDLHRWLREHVDLWASVYQQERYSKSNDHCHCDVDFVSHFEFVKFTGGQNIISIIIAT